MRNKILTERIDDLEKQLLDKGFVSPSKLQLEQAIRRDLLRLNNENIELKFELEALRSDTTRYKVSGLFPVSCVCQHCSLNLKKSK